VGEGAWLLEPCRAATTEAITLSGLQTIDSVSLSSGNRVLVKDQASAAANGVYVAGSGGWSRATDLDEATEFRRGLGVAVLGGTDQENTIWLLKSTVSTLGSDAVDWEQVQGSGGGGGGLGKYQVLTGENTVPAVNNTYLVLPGNNVTYNILLPANENCEAGDWLEFMSDASQRPYLVANTAQAIIASQSPIYTDEYNIPASNFQLRQRSGGNRYEGVGVRLVYLGRDTNKAIKEFDVNGDPVLDEYDQPVYSVPSGGTGVWKLFYSTSYLND
jgi:phage-related tail fiber protein